MAQVSSILNYFLFSFQNEECINLSGLNEPPKDSQSKPRKKEFVTQMKKEKNLNKNKDNKLMPLLT